MTPAWRQLLARYDGATLRPPAACSPPTPQERARFEAWRGWCLERSTGAARQPLRVTELQGLAPEQAVRLATQLALERDGSWQLAACRGAPQRLALRLTTKLHDAMAWRVRQDSDPWDSGWLRNDAAGLAALARFAPRRATLMLAQGLPSGPLQAVLDGLSQRAPQWRHAVRVLVIPGSADAPAAAPASDR